MKHILFLLLLLVCRPSTAQTGERQPIRLYRVADQVVVADSGGNQPRLFPYQTVSVRAFGSLVRVTLGGRYYDYAPARFRDEMGVAYSSTSAAAAVAGYLSLGGTPGGPAMGYYQVSTYAQAVALATGTRPKRIRVTGEAATYEYWPGSPAGDHLELQLTN